VKVTVTKYYEEYILKDKKLRKKMKIKEEKKYKNLVFLFMKSFSELYYYLNNLLSFGSFNIPTQSINNGSACPSVASFFQENIPIILVENLQYVGVIPEEPPFVHYDSDDDEVAIPVGKEESVKLQQQKWISMRPHRVNVEFSLNNPTIPNPTPVVSKGSNKKDISSTGKKQVIQPVFADCVAAVEELYCMLLKRPSESQGKNNRNQGEDEEGEGMDEEKNEQNEQIGKVEESKGNAVIWIDHNPQSLFNHKSTFYRLSSFNKKPNLFTENRLVSYSLRESLLWCSILQLQPQFSSIVADIRNNFNDFQFNLQNYSSLSEHFYRLFGKIIESSTSAVPASLFVLGGELRMDKFRVLDELLSLVSAQGVCFS
jgi:hypothetical protein